MSIAKKNQFDIYIGRPCRGFKGSPFANPFKIPADGNRAAVIEKYKQWLLFEDFEDFKQAERSEIWRRIRAGELANKILGCWCAPQRCHGDILAEIVNNLLS